MPEFRQNLATKEWVVIATERAKRPEDFSKQKQPQPDLADYEENCPFCPGNEHQTPPEVFSIKEDGRWVVRVVPNKFAALRADHSTERNQVGRFLCADGFGVAEVIIETPSHNKPIALMNEAEVQKMVVAYKNRYDETARNPKVNLITIFRNHGQKAGTSLEHPHSQLIATPIVPPHVRDPISQATLYYDSHGSCVFCDILQEELRQKERIIMESEYFVAFAPYASRTPFETRIYPRRHCASFAWISEDEITDFANILRQTMRKIHFGLDNPHYNYLLRSAPIGDEDVRYYHWYVVIIPRITTPAGFEMGTGIYINITYPEKCAGFLRNVEV